MLDADAIARHYDAGGEEPPDPPDPPDSTGFGLEVIEYAPGSDPHHAPLANTHRLRPPTAKRLSPIYRTTALWFATGPGDAFQVSPVPVSGQHSVVYNPADGLYYADGHGQPSDDRFSPPDLASGTIAAQTNNIAGVALNRVHDVVIDHDTGWIYALNPNSGHVFRFTPRSVKTRA